MKNQKPIDMAKILPFLRDLYIVYKRPFHSHYLVELIGDLLIRNRLSAKWIYGDVEAPIQHVDYDQETNSIIIRGIQVSPKAVLRNAPVNAKIIDLITYEHALKQKLSLTCPIFTNFKDLSQFIGKSVEQISDILKCDNQKFFIDTVNIKTPDFSDQMETTGVTEKTKDKSEKNENQAGLKDEQEQFLSTAACKNSEIFNRFEDKSYKKILFTDFDGILSSGYIRSSNGSISKTINYGNKTAVDLAHELGYKVICITASNNTESVRISKDVCKECKFDAFYQVSNPESKFEIMQYLAMEHDISLDDCVYIGDDFYDSEIFPKIGISFAPKTSKAILLNQPDVWLSSNQPFLEAVYIIQISIQPI